MAEGRPLVSQSQYVLKELDRLSMIVIQSNEQLQALRVDVNVTREVCDERIAQLRENIRQGYQEIHHTLQRLQTIIHGNGQASMLQRFASLEERITGLATAVTHRLEALEETEATQAAWWWKLGGELLKMAIVGLVVYFLSIYKKL